MAFTVTNDQSLNGGANLIGDGELIIPLSGPSYEWTDIDGGGTDASDDLDLAGKQLTTTDGTALTFKLQNGNGNGQVAGSNTLAIWTQSSGGAAGDVAIYEVGDIAIGGIRTRPAPNTKYTGKVTIGSDVTPAGNVRIDFIDTHGGNQQYTGDVTIHGNGDVKIQTASGVSGNIDTSSRTYWGRTDTVGEVHIHHAGDLVAAQISSYAYSDNYSKGGNVVLDGGDSSGACSVNKINASYNHPDRWSGGSYGYFGGHITVSNYNEVNIGTVKTSYVDRRVNITGISGNINIGVAESSGVSSGGDTRYFGFLSMTCDGIATLGALDLAVVTNVYMSSGLRKKSFIQGSLAGFDTANPATSGLDTPSGYRICYNYESGGLNDYLGGQDYTLKSGGLLGLLPPQGTMFRIR